MSFGDYLNVAKTLYPDQTLKNQFLLSEVISEGEKISDLKKTEGLYSFWLIKEEVIDFDKLHFSLEVKSKKGQEDDHKVTWDWNHDKKYIPLYIGKSTVIGKRIRQHLGPINENNWFENAPKGNFIYKRNSTTVQFRSGIEQLVRKNKSLTKSDNKNALHYFADKIIIKYFEESEMVDRFYIEDFAIGYFKPWFNIDAER